MAKTVTNGKGSKRRPMKISQNEFQEHWDSINWDKKKEKDKPDQKPEDTKDKSLSFD